MICSNSSSLGVLLSLRSLRIDLEVSSGCEVDETEET
jgi:hypothetical protein